MIPADTPGPQGSPALLLLTAILFAEAAAMVIVVIVLVIDILTLPAASLGSAIALTVLVAIAAVFVSAVAIGAFRRQGWVRGAALIWQLVQLAIAIGAFQGTFAQPAIGWALLVPSVTVIILLFTRSVMAQIRRSP
ncbi:hypothetical protein [Mycetocola sp. 2940]|uniref:hypothetical protein n=1 Tax=Mycetocola sp. 2940 TaxID=3156452 RepID=UPI0033987B9B